MSATGSRPFGLDTSGLDTSGLDTSGLDTSGLDTLESGPFGSCTIGLGTFRSGAVRGASAPAVLRRVLALIALVFVTLGGPPALAADVPYLTGRVVDDAEILSPVTRERLAADLAAHEQRTTNQIVVLTIPSLGGTSVEDFATQVFEAWKLGQKGRDNGVLVIVAPQDRRMRIEVGYGLEGTLTDVQAARIIREQMTARFKSEDYDAGVTAGVDAIIATLEGRAPAPRAADRGGSTSGERAEGLGSFDIAESELPPWPMRILIGAFIFGVLGLFTLMGVLTPGMGWFLYLFLIPFWAMFPIIVLGFKGALALLTLHLIGFPIAKFIVSRRPGYAKAKEELKRTGRTTFGGMVITSGGSSSGGSSSAGGGFSGGGGSSGGGGASGSW